VWSLPLCRVDLLVIVAAGFNSLHGIFEGHAFGIIFPEPCFGRVLIGENLQMVAIADQGPSLESLRTRSSSLETTLNFRAEPRILQQI
jgi:hypothetical protein